jgi:hypothetical protein
MTSTVIVAVGILMMICEIPQVLVRDAFESTSIAPPVEPFEGGGTRFTGERRVANGEGLFYLRAR